MVAAQLVAGAGVHVGLGVAVAVAVAVAVLGVAVAVAVCVPVAVAVVVAQLDPSAALATPPSGPVNTTNAIEARRAAAPSARPASPTRCSFSQLICLICRVRRTIATIPPVVGLSGSQVPIACLGRHLGLGIRGGGGIRRVPPSMPACGSLRWATERQPGDREEHGHGQRGQAADLRDR